MVATLYHIPRTISSPIVQILLELNLVNNPIQVEEISFRALKSKEHLAINPMGTSPTFHDTELDIMIWESGAVLTYILERYDTEYQFYPQPINYHTSTPNEIQIRTKYLHIKQFIIATVYPFVATMFLHSLKPIHEQDTKYMAAAKHKCHTIFCPLLLKWLSNDPYLLGEDISAIDFLAIKPLRNMHSMGIIQDDFPILNEYFDRITDRPSYVEAYNDGFDMSTIVDRSMILIPTKSKQQQMKQREDSSTNSGSTSPTTTLSTSAASSSSSSSSSSSVKGKAEINDNTLLESYKTSFQESPVEVATAPPKKRGGFPWASGLRNKFLNDDPK